jgi:hypothetical protein
MARSLALRAKLAYGAGATMWPCGHVAMGSANGFIKHGKCWKMLENPI